MLLIFEDIGCEIRVKSADRFYMGEIRDGKLMHVRSGVTATQLRQIADKLDELNGVKKRRLSDK